MTPKRFAPPITPPPAAASDEWEEYYDESEPESEEEEDEEEEEDYEEEILRQPKPAPNQKAAGPSSAVAGTLDNTLAVQAANNKGEPSATAASSGGKRRELSEMRELYPYLAEVVRAKQEEHGCSVLFNREFLMIDDDKARALESKIKKQKTDEVKVLQRGKGVFNEVTNTLMDLLD